MVHKGVLAALGIGAAFLGYCVYFDRKRRSDPEFRTKLMEKRRKQREAKESQDANKYPDLTDTAAVQRFFLSELQLGEQLMAIGDIENGVEHLANAVAVTSQKEQLLEILRGSIPPQIFSLIIQKLPEVSQKIFNSMKAKTYGDNEPKIVDVSETNIAIDECLD